VIGLLLIALSACAGQGRPVPSPAAGTTTIAGEAAVPSDDPTPGTGTGALTRTTAAGPAAAGPAVEPVEPAAEGKAPDQAAAQPQLVLEAAGLGVVVDDTRIDHLPFGTAASTVRGVVERLLGRLATRRRTDCGPGPRTSSVVEGFELLFHADRFVGWVDHGAPGRRLTSGDGIGVGVTVAALERSGTDVTVTRVEGGRQGQWTSGPGGLYGRATSVSPRGRVTLVSSGQACLD
jgi:hypothetical protein